MIRKVSIAVALAAALVTLTPAPAHAQGSQGADALSRVRENIRLSAERDFYDRVANVEDRSAAAGLFAMPGARPIPPMEGAPSSKGWALGFPGMDHAVKTMQAQPIMVTPWFFDCFNGVGVAIRGRLF